MNCSAREKQKGWPQIKSTPSISAAAATIHSPTEGAPPSIAAQRAGLRLSRRRAHPPPSPLSAPATVSAAAGLLLLLRRRSARRPLLPRSRSARRPPSPPSPGSGATDLPPPMLPGLGRPGRVAAVPETARRRRAAPSTACSAGFLPPHRVPRLAGRPARPHRLQSTGHTSATPPGRPSPTKVTLP
ncbi:hypothetical protein DAI22_01g198200 [Oryza sativa Japonica Group]|nr:hypothetical protein DAI22_01g198200 [Oryza sativa Japonica Group]